MKRKWLNIYICSFLMISLTIIPSIYPIKASFKRGLTTSSQKILNGGWLEERDGFKILYINGSHYEMGYQHGSLLKDECLENLRALINYSESRGYSYNQLLENWNSMEKHVPEDYLEEMRGLAQGIGEPFESVAAFYSTFNSIGILSCFGIAAWDIATHDKKLVHARSFDLSFNMKDPITGKYAHENCILIVRKPDEKYASLNPSVALSITGGGGMNEKGIAIGGQLSWSNDQTLDGLPLIIREQIVLDNAASAEEAIELLNLNRSLGVNFILSDSNIPCGYAVETTASLTYNGTWDNLIESNYPFWPINHVIRRTNFFIDPELSETQRDRYNPGGIIGFIKSILALFQNNDDYISLVMYPIWRKYRTMSYEIEDYLGLLNMNNMITFLSKVYNGKTDIFLAITRIFGRGLGFLESWNQWVACPEIGEMRVRFASRCKYASHNPYHRFNLFEMLDS